MVRNIWSLCGAPLGPLSLKRLATGGLLALSSVGGVQAKPSDAAEYELSNGLRVILAPRAGDQDAYVVVKYAAGQTAAPAGFKGLPHLAEHLTYHGSRHIGPLDYAKHLDLVGGGYNGMTKVSSTVYFATVPPNALQIVLWLESDRMAFALDGVTEKALEAEKKIVSMEWREKNSLHRRVERRKAAVLYGKEGPGVPDPDEVSNVEAVNLSGARWFIQSTHRPDNATLAIGGNFDAAVARKWVERYFASIENPALPKLEAEFPPPRLCGAHKLHLGHGYVDNPTLTVTWPMKAATSERDRWAKRTFAEMLEDYLTNELVVERPVADSVTASTVFYDSHGLLDVSVRLHANKVFGPTEAVVLGAVEALASAPLDDSLIEGYKTKWQLDAEMLEEDGLGTLLRRLEGEEPQRSKAAIDSLSGKDIQREAQGLLKHHLTTLSEPLERARRLVSEITSEDPCQ